MTALASVLNAAAMLTITLSLFYYITMLATGLRMLRKQGLPLSVQSKTAYENPYLNDSGSYDIYFLIPCLNEAAVILQTVQALAGNQRATIVVVDDGSDDETASIARSAGGHSVVVVSRSLPHARKGKGAALNAGFQKVRQLVLDRGQEPTQVLICVMDADGRLSDGALAEVLPLFDNAGVGGAQLAVRIRNRNTNFLTRFQDFQFWSMSAISQLGRKRTGTVSLGGNGQFTRFSALIELGGSPWSASLTEDLDLAISLLTNGWQLETAPNASVDQQAVERLKSLFIQRRRWYQGHMMAGTRIAKVWNEPSISHLRALEITGYLAVPWIFDLPWSVLSHWTLAWFIINAPSVFSYVDGPVSLIIGVLVWYLLTFAPATLTAAIYFQRDRRSGFWKSYFMGHSFLVMNYLSYACVWGALFRIVRRQTGWDKTTRSAEDALVDPSRAGVSDSRPLDT